MHTRVLLGEQSGQDWTHPKLHTAHVCTRMTTTLQLPVGKWPAQVRRGALYRNAVFPSKRDAKDWAAAIEGQAQHIAASGFAPVSKTATVG